MACREINSNSENANTTNAPLKLLPKIFPVFRGKSPSDIVHRHEKGWVVPWEDLERPCN